MIKHVLTTAALSLAMGLSTAYAADMGAKDEPIKLAINEWTSQHISTHIEIFLPIQVPGCFCVCLH